MTQPTVEQIQLVRDRFAKNKTFFRRQSLRSKRAWAITRTATVLVSAMVTIILGLKKAASLNIAPEVDANLALVLSATVTALATIDATFDFQWTWINYSLTLTRIYGLEDELEYLISSGGITEVKLDSIFRQLQDVLADINASWRKRRLNGEGHAEASDKA